MNGMLVVVLIGIGLAAAMTVWFAGSLLRKKNLRASNFIASALTESQGPGKVLALLFYIWSIFYVLSLGMLLFSAVVSGLYVVALIHGEIFAVLKTGPSAGVIMIHLAYPIEVFLIGITIIFLVSGSAQLFFGPIEPLHKLRLRVKGIEDFSRKLIFLMMPVLMIELLKTALYTTLAYPKAVNPVFAHDVSPLMRPVPLALLVAGSFVLGGVVVGALKRGRK